MLLVHVPFFGSFFAIFSVAMMITAVPHITVLLSKSESVKFSLIESVIFLFTVSSVKKYFSLLNHLIFTESSVKKIFFTVKSVNFH